MKRLPVGDAIWIARHKVLDTEYVLDFIVERKNVDDLVDSIRDNRYKDQKLRMQVPSELAFTFVIVPQIFHVDCPISPLCFQFLTDSEKTLLS
jgi:ERCC4-type nuclease